MVSQLQYDVTEFVFLNKEDINAMLNEDSTSIAISEQLFKDYPEMYDNLLNDFRKSLLKNFLIAILHIDSESLSIIVDDNFMKMLE